jgi:hypothetical protein
VAEVGFNHLYCGHVFATQRLQKKCDATASGQAESNKVVLVGEMRFIIFLLAVTILEIRTPAAFALGR